MSMVSATAGADPGTVSTAMKGETLLEVKGLKMHFPITEGIVFQKTAAGPRWE